MSTREIAREVFVEGERVGRFDARLLLDRLSGLGRELRLALRIRWEQFAEVALMDLRHPQREVEERFFVRAHFLKRACRGRGCDVADLLFLQFERSGVRTLGVP